jgi:hypothetical protein
MFSDVMQITLIVLSNSNIIETAISTQIYVSGRIDVIFAEICSK